MSLTETEKAWLAGLFEGEGCFSIEGNGATRCTIRMTDKDIIERIHSLFPGLPMQTVVAKKPRDPGGKLGKTGYVWRISHPELVREFIELILPWLGERRTKKALDVLYHLDTRPGTGGRQRAKTHCIHGHEFTPENTQTRIYTKKDGRSFVGRRCRACAREGGRKKKDVVGRGAYGSHVRWHVNQGVFQPACEFCVIAEVQRPSN